LQLHSRRPYNLSISLLMLLQGCATYAGPAAQPPPPTSKQCDIRNYKAETVYTAASSGAIVWTVTFDVATRQLLESRTATIGGKDLKELDCLLNLELHEECPRWLHDGNVAVGLEDGRLQASGLCKPESDTET